MIHIKGVHKSFGAQQVLRGVDLEIPNGETIAIVGPSGTGKSVLLKLITGLLTVDAGDITIGGDSVTGAKGSEQRRKICEKMGVLFQSAALFDSLNLYDNVAFPLRHRPGARHLYKESEIQERVLMRLEEVGLQGYELAYPGEVSIGMRKRVGIARTLVSNPEVILFDEPNTGLDPQVGQEIYELIVETRKRASFTGIVISHEIPEVFQVCNRVAMLFQGEVQEEGSVEEFLASEKPVVRQFIEGRVSGPIQMNF